VTPFLAPSVTGAGREATAGSPREPRRLPGHARRARLRIEQSAERDRHVAAERRADGATDGERVRDARPALAGRLVEVGETGGRGAIDGNPRLPYGAPARAGNELRVELIPTVLARIGQVGRKRATEGFG